MNSQTKYSKDDFHSSLILPDDQGIAHFFPYGPFGESYILSYDQLQRAQNFIESFLLWGALSVLILQYLVGFVWTASFILLYLFTYFVRIQFLIRLGEKGLLSTNLEEISLKLVEQQTIGNLLLANLFFLGFSFWCIYQISRLYPLPLPMLISCIFTLVISLVLFTFTTVLLFYKGQSLQK